MSCDHQLLGPEDDQSLLRQYGGGKAANMWKLSHTQGCDVPSWFCLSTHAFRGFLKTNNLEELTAHVDASSDLSKVAKNIQQRIKDAALPDELSKAIACSLVAQPFDGRFVAVRSSGADEDSASHSFAGQFDTLLYQRGFKQVVSAIRQCWASCFAERVMTHRRDCNLPVAGSGMAVIVQVMINSETSGVAFSRHPLKPVSCHGVYIEAVHGIGEGLVSGELDPDSYEVMFDTWDVSAQVVDKTGKFVQHPSGGVEKVDVEGEARKSRTLTDDQARAIAHVMVDLEAKGGRPQDFEWAYENGKLYCLQVRPVVTLPPTCFLDLSVLGKRPTLWDNSNIVESYSGVTSPLTFSFASFAYEKVYTLTLLVAGVPPNIVHRFRPYLANMLGLVRGNIYYNLANWYRALSCIPLGDTSKFMETMMGVKQGLGTEVQELIDDVNESAPTYSIWSKFRILCGAAYKVYYIDHLVEGFFEHFNSTYKMSLTLNFNAMPLQEQVGYMNFLFEETLGRWEVPIINDTYVMLFFGLLKKLVARWMSSEDSIKVQSLQNDLLCGQGDVESTEPTKMLMRIAAFVNESTNSDCDLRQWFLSSPEEVLSLLSGLGASNIAEQRNSGGLRHRKGGEKIEDRSLEKLQAEVVSRIHEFLRKYGFRCINELKLEEKTLHDDPGFVVDAIAGYLRTGAYSISAMEEREAAIRDKAEEEVAKCLNWPQRLLFNWVLYHARRGVRHRENTRFSRTKLFGVFRDLFRAMGRNLVKLNLLDNFMDVFYLTIREIEEFVEGRSVTNNLAGLVALRKAEFNSYKQGLTPPERFMSRGAAGPYMLFPQLLDDLDLLAKAQADRQLEPGQFVGTPCCPGVVEGVVRVVKTIEETKGLNGEILVTARTDPGWVPLYPLCSGLAIERGSLLSHSAVVARELGLPTIVGVSGLMKNLKTGMRVRVDAGKGELRILEEDNDDRSPNAEMEKKEEAP